MLHYAVRELAEATIYGSKDCVSLGRAPKADDSISIYSEYPELIVDTETRKTCVYTPIAVGMHTMKIYFGADSVGTEPRGRLVRIKGNEWEIHASARIRTLNKGTNRAEQVLGIGINVEWVWGIEKKEAAEIARKLLRAGRVGRSTVEVSERERVFKAILRAVEELIQERNTYERDRV